MDLRELIPDDAGEEQLGTEAQQGSTEPQQEVQQPQQEQQGIDLSPGGIAQGLAAPVVGTVDAGIGLINSLTPDVIGDIPELPDLPNEGAQTLREISEGMSADIVATVAARRLGVRGLRRFGGTGFAQGAAKRLPNFLRRSPVAKKTAKELALLPGEIGASVGATALTFDMEEAAEEGGGQNLTTMYRNWARENNLPSWMWNFIPSWLTVGTSDSPEFKRAKNMMEAGLFPFALSIPGTAYGGFKIAKSSMGVDRATQAFRIPMDDAARQADASGKLNPIPEFTGDAKTDLNVAMNKSEAALDEIGKFNLEQAGDSIDRPIKGVHDMFDDAEINMRTRDNDGVAGAMDDLVRIDGDIDSYNGRVGNPFSEAAVQRAVSQIGSQTDVDLVDNLIKEIKEMGSFRTELPSGKSISPELRTKVMNKYAYLVSNPNVAPEVISKLQRMINKLGVLGKGITYEGQIRGLDNMLKAMDPDRIKGQTLAQMSLSGQAADMASAALDNIDTLIGQGSKSMVMDRIKLLYYLKQVDAAEAGNLLNNQKLIQNALGKENVDEMLGIAEEFAGQDPGSMLAKARENAANFSKSLDMMSADPELTKVFLEATKAFNGRPDAMGKLMNYVSQRFGSLHKGVYDSQTKIKQAFMEDIGSMVYNNVLSSSVTGLNATLGNIGGLADQIIANSIGSIFRGDWRQLASNAAGVRSMMSMHQRHLKAGLERFQMAVDNPMSVNKLRRSEDLILQDEQAVEATRLLGEYFSKQGDDNLKDALEYHKMLTAWNNDPILRVVPNFMMATDATTSSMMAAFEAGRMAHLGGITKKGKLKPIKSAREFAGYSNRYYRELLDENGVLREGSYASQEAKRITLTADSKFAESLQNLTAKVPMARTLFMFPRTMANMAASTASFVPFADKLSAFRVPSKMLGDDKLVEILKRQGYTKFGNRTPRQMYDVLRTNAQGRAYTGAFLVSSVGLMAASGNIRGKGSVDPEIQRARGKDWKEYTVKVGNTWHSYAWMGPVAKLIGLPADIIDNYNRADEAWTEGTLGKLGLIFAQMLEDENIFMAMRPVVDVLQGKGDKAAARWAAGTANNFIPAASFWSDVGEVVNPGVENIERDFTGYFINRQPLLGLAVPDERNVVTGEKIGADINPFQRALNALTPFKSNGEISPVEQMLVDMEFDVNPYVDGETKMFGGVPMSYDERDFYTTAMSKDKVFHRELKDFYKLYKDSGLWDEIRKARRDGVTSDQLNSKKYKNFYARLSIIWQRARERAKMETLFEYPDFAEEVREVGSRDKANELGIILDLN